MAAKHELPTFADRRCSDFFWDVTWNRTVIVISEPLRRIHCLLASDTD
ncbi:MAG: hypothetical protein JWM59_2673 [Verrucomicrobiales bacterium]|nr:hypothetical protein [Verrucomicrobiales bacterium]